MTLETARFSVKCQTLCSRFRTAWAQGQDAACVQRPGPAGLAPGGGGGRPPGGGTATAGSEPRRHGGGGGGADGGGGARGRGGGPGADAGGGGAVTGSGPAAQRALRVAGARTAGDRGAWQLGPPSWQQHRLQCLLLGKQPFAHRLLPQRVAPRTLQQWPLTPQGSLRLYTAVCGSGLHRRLLSDFRAYPATCLIAALSYTQVVTSLRGLILELYDAHLSPDGRTVDYRALKSDARFKAFVDATAELQKVGCARSPKSAKAQGDG